MMKKRLFLLATLVALLSVSTVGLYTLARPAPVAHAAPPTSHTMIRASGSTAIAEFAITQGNITDFVAVFASPEGLQQPSISGPAVGVSISECTQVGEEGFCVGFLGMEPAPGLTFDTKKLSSVTLPDMTVPVATLGADGNPSGPPVFDVSLVGLTWTGVGAITRESRVTHYRVGHTFSEMTRFKGTSREAMMSGTVSYPAPTLGPLTFTGADAVFTILSTNASIDVTIQR